MSLLRAENLSFAYAGGEPVLKGLDLSVEPGEFLSLLGPSGCGKSTLLRLLSGFLAPAEGQVFLCDRPVTGPAPQGQMIFQDPAQLLPWLTVEGNIRLAARGTAPGKPSQGPALEDVLAMTGLGRYGSSYPHQLSGGLKQRAALARALFAQPSILFMDEPFGSLDAPARRELQKLLLSLWKAQDFTVLFVSHDIPETLLLADRLLVFPGDGGEPFLQENPLPRPREAQSEVFRREQLRFYSLVDSL